METLLHDFRIESGSLRSEDNESYKMMKKICWLRLIYYLTEIINYYFLLYIFFIFQMYPGKWKENTSKCWISIQELHPMSSFS